MLVVCNLADQCGCTQCPHQLPHYEVDTEGTYVFCWLATVQHCVVKVEDKNESED